MKNFLFILFIMGLTIPVFGQETGVFEIEIEPVSYKYLDKEDGTAEPAQPLRLLQKDQTIFNLRSSDLYQDQYPYYFLSFHIPEGKILASYDKDDNFLRTVERLKNTEIPPVIAQAIVQKYPRWTVSENVYLVNHHDNGEIKRKEYKFLLEKGNLRMRIRTDENGNFIKS